MKYPELKSKKELIEKYNELYSEVQEIIKTYNPCNITNGLCERFKLRIGNNLCCEGCNLLDNKLGCTTKNLACSIWFCHPKIYNKISNEVVSRLNSICDEAYHYNFIQIRTSYDKIIEDSWNSMNEIETKYYGFD